MELDQAGMASHFLCVLFDVLNVYTAKTIRQVLHESLHSRLTSIAVCLGDYNLEWFDKSSCE